MGYKARLRLSGGTGCRVQGEAQVEEGGGYRLQGTGRGSGCGGASCQAYRQPIRYHGQMPAHLLRVQGTGWSRCRLIS